MKLQHELIFLKSSWNYFMLQFDEIFYTKQKYLDKSKVPWGFQDREVTGWWYFKSSDKNETQAAEGLATTDKGSTEKNSKK